jgi:hypothetical protein
MLSGRRRNEGSCHKNRTPIAKSLDVTLDVMANIAQEDDQDSRTLCHEVKQNTIAASKIKVDARSRPWTGEKCGLSPRPEIGLNNKAFNDQLVRARRKLLAGFFLPVLKLTALC